MPDRRRLQDAFAGPFIVDPMAFSDYVIDQMREDAEEKPINLSTTLSAALNKSLWQIVDAACIASGLPHKGPRKQKVAALTARLMDASHLAQLVTGLSPQGRAILQRTLDAGGWIKVGELTREFGSQDGDGLFWNERPPKSHIGQVRARGLLFVGKAGISGRNFKIAVIPKELREPLTAIVKSSGV